MNPTTTDKYRQSNLATRIRRFPDGEFVRNTALRYRHAVAVSGDRAELAAIEGLPDAAVAAIAVGLDPTEWLV